MRDVNVFGFAHYFIRIRRISIGTKLPGVGTVELKLVCEKEAKLKSCSVSILASINAVHTRYRLEVTWIFAQYETGTAASIADGWALICAHLYGEDEEEFEASTKRKWLLSHTGQLWDAKSDLALLKIVSVETNETVQPRFSFSTLSAKKPAVGSSILCIRQPGKDGLEYTMEQEKQNTACSRSRKDGSRVYCQEILRTIRRLIPRFTIVGRTGDSGCPMIRGDNGTLIGLHSSWDDQPGIRHEIPEVAITEFLDQRTLVAVEIRHKPKY
ncbi:hypothetical protein BJ878DRAFT_336007 [Calycina marina]|uniref:Serine protease n=1 Tax=Calycina marina TaxID=1763456 RepID=A0A9P8CG18_9HELO|nr:hypothetical protein BJ878DRAFT_336007 [Calycina marina]